MFLLWDIAKAAAESARSADTFGLQGSDRYCCRSVHRVLCDVVAVVEKLFAAGGGDFLDCVVVPDWLASVRIISRNSTGGILVTNQFRKIAG